MEAVNDILSMLDLLPQSAFCVKDGIIVHANPEAKKNRRDMICSLHGRQ